MQPTETTNKYKEIAYCCICNKKVQYPDYVNMPFGKFILQTCSNENCQKKLVFIKSLHDNPMKAKLC